MQITNELQFSQNITSKAITFSIDITYRYPLTGSKFVCFALLYKVFTLHNKHQLIKKMYYM